MKIYKVGGAVRDSLMGVKPSDTDWVVIGSSPEEMISAGYKPIGKDFPVFLHPKTNEEFALARTEKKTGTGYGGFTFYYGADVSLEEDLSRRDFTINAIAQDSDGNIIDPFNGQKDIENKLLYYKGLFSYKDNVKFVYNNYRDKYTSLVDEIEETTDKKNVNYRLAHFYNYNTTIIKSILWWLKVIYWIFYVIMFVLFILKRQFKDVKSWPFIIFAGLFPLLFEYGLSWKNPFKKEISKVPSIYEAIFDTFKHSKIDNIYFISFSLVVLTLLVFSFFSMLPY